MDRQRVLDALSILSGLVATGAGLGWIFAVIARALLRRRIPIADWVMHGGGAGWVIGMALAIAYLVS